MDSQTATLYDTTSISKCGLTELSFNAVNKPKVPEKCQKTGSSASTHSKRFVIVPSTSNLEKLSPSIGPSLLTSPVMSPSASFCKPKHHHGSMRSVRSGR